MYQHLTDWETHAENMQISVCFCKTCICLKNLENIQISVNMINRLDITDEYSVKCDFILNTVTFIDSALNISLRKLWKCNVLWFYLFGQGVPNETKGTINLKQLSQYEWFVSRTETPYRKCRKNWTRSSSSEMRKRMVQVWELRDLKPVPLQKATQTGNFTLVNP